MIWKPAARICRSKRERQAPLLLEPQRRRNLRALSRLGRQPRLGHDTTRRPPSTPARPSTGPPSRRPGSWRPCPTSRSIAGRRATERRPCLGKLVPSRISTPRALGNHRAQLPPDALGAPRRMRDEMLERLIRPGIGDALEHRAHRLAATVAEQAEQVATKGPALRDVTEAHLERLEPVAQLIEPRRSVARQSRQHRATAYRTCVKSTRL